ncbi:phospholipid scramblase 1-like isoform X2 [Homarus americanus]|uniref:phospholipid scramblase 1-like isoform X2 n=1 Tax=Homarus americanus TaxID=6706 RepID=UPI001C465AC9|nr:phospholipid scramblase 1-like isoform X2 [Homarus americanus]
MEMQDSCVPPGLEYLVELDQVLIHQLIEVFELLTGWEMRNKYVLKNNMGQQFLFAKEQSTFCSRWCCGNIRAFQMGINDNNEQEVLRLDRPLNCAGCCTPCCLQELEVTNQGMLLGSVHQEWSFCTPWAGKYSIKNASGDVVFRLKAPCCVCSCGSDIIFPTGNNRWVRSERFGEVSAWRVSLMLTTLLSPSPKTWTSV